MTDYPLKEMMDHGLLVTINSDDPAYFGGYMNENYMAVADSLNLDHNHIAELAENGIKSSWMNADQKERHQMKVKEVLAQYQ